MCKIKIARIPAMVLIVFIFAISSVFSAVALDSDITIEDEVVEKFDKFSNNDPDAYILANKRPVSIEEDFNLDRVIVVLKHKYSIINSVKNASIFSSSLFSDVKDLSYVENYSEIDEEGISKVNKDEFHQILSLKLKEPGKENALEAVKALDYRANIDLKAVELDYYAVAT